MIQWLYDNKLFVLLGIATLFGFFWLYQFKDRLKAKTPVLLAIAILHTGIGLVSVKVFAFLESGEAGGMSLFGGVFFMPLLYFAVSKLTKRDTADVFDIFAVCMITTLFCARINCLLGGCCLGIKFPGTDFRIPTREMELVFYAILFLAVRKKVCRRNYRGLIYPIYLISYGVFRFCVEWLRESTNTVGFIHLGHIWALVAVAVGSGFYYYLTKNNPTAKKQNKKKSKIKTRRKP